VKAVAVFPGKPNSMHLADLLEPSVDEVTNGCGVLVEVLLEMTREFFDPSRLFKPDEHPPSRREVCIGQDKKVCFFPSNRYTDEGGAPK